MPFVKVCLLEQVYSNEFQRGYNFVRLDNCNHSEINKHFQSEKGFFFIYASCIANVITSVHKK